MPFIGVFRAVSVCSLFRRYGAASFGLLRSYGTDTVAVFLDTAHLYLRNPTVFPPMLSPCPQRGVWAAPLLRTSIHTAEPPRRAQASPAFPPPGPCGRSQRARYNNAIAPNASRCLPVIIVSLRAPCGAVRQQSLDLPLAGRSVRPLLHPGSSPNYNATEG